MAVPGSSPVVVIDADEDSGFTASVDSKLANEYYLYMLVLKIISSWPPESVFVHNEIQFCCFTWKLLELEKKL